MCVLTGGRINDVVSR